MIVDRSTKWSRAGFRAFSKQFTPEEIETALGVKPTDSHHLGEPRSSRSNSTFPHHAFFIHSGISSDRPMPEHLEKVVSALEAAIIKPSELDSEIQTDIFCGFSSDNGQGGFAISPEMLSRIAALGVKVDLDLYPPSDAGET